MTERPQIGVPEIGWYWTRHVRGGAKVAARIYWSVAKDEDTGEPLDRSPVMLAELDGKFVDPYDLWPRVCGHGITEAEYKFMRAEASWAREYAPDDAVANPNVAVDLGSMAPILPPGVR